MEWVKRWSDGQDSGEGGVADQSEEPDHERYDGHAHAFGGLFGFGLGVGQFVFSQGSRLGGEAGADAGAALADEGERRGQFGQVLQPEVVGEGAERLPR